jgi:gamma-glutamyltranspeptidase/glutathione hydrolase
MNQTRTFLVAVALAWLALAPVYAGPTETIGVAPKALPEQAQGKPPSFAGKAFRQGVVSVANPHGAEAGAQVLEAGGNAIDAAVAIAYALNVVEPQSAGVGGGGFMMIHRANTGETVMIDTRERAPGGAARNMFVEPTGTMPSASQQGRAVGVPGMVKGTALAVERYGHLPLASSIEPAIRLAAEGFAATPRYVDASCSGRARAYAETAAYFCPNGTSRVAVGEIVKNEPLAETFRAIAQGGPGAFYSGDIAKGIVEGQKRYLNMINPLIPYRGGSMTTADLANYQVDVRQPYEGTYRGYIIRSVPSPSSGGLTLLMMLKMIERFPIGDAEQGYGFGSTRTLNVMAEALRIGFAERAVWMGDADFSYVPARGLLNPAFLTLRSAAINPDARMSTPSATDVRPFDIAGFRAGTRLAVAEPAEVLENGTTHFSVTDQWGNMVSYTNTIESSHGIGVFAGYYEPNGTFRNFGFLLNNELTDFNTTPSINPFTGEFGTNDVAPNKRPRSSMTPTLVFSPDGKPIAALGSPGGTTIIPAVFNVLLNLIDHRMTVQDAIDAPRISVTAANGAIAAEPGFALETITGLRALGHTVNVASELNIGSVQVVITDQQTGKQYGGADSRREGTVIGLPR